MKNVRTSAEKLRDAKRQSDKTKHYNNVICLDSYRTAQKRRTLHQARSRNQIMFAPLISSSAASIPPVPPQAMQRVRRLNQEKNSSQPVHQPKRPADEMIRFAMIRNRAVKTRMLRNRTRRNTQIVKAYIQEQERDNQS